MELWFACKSLASSLCVEARLLTQIFDTSSQLRLEECSTSCQLTAPAHCCPTWYHQLSTPSPARDFLPMRVCVHSSAWCTAVSYAARSLTCRTRSSSTRGTQGPCSTMPTDDGYGLGRRCPRPCRWSSNVGDSAASGLVSAR